MSLLLGMVFTFIFILSNPSEAEAGAEARRVRVDYPALFELMGSPESPKEIWRHLKEFIATSTVPTLVVPKDAFKFSQASPLLALLETLNGERVQPENSWREREAPAIGLGAAGPELDEQPVSRNFLKALWHFIPEEFFAAGKVDRNSCDSITPILGLLSYLGLRAEPATFAALSIDESDFAQWMRLYVTLGNVTEMGFSPCNSAYYYVYVMWPQIVGYNRYYGVHMTANSKPEDYLMQQAYAPGWSTQIRFKRWDTNGTVDPAWIR